MNTILAGANAVAIVLFASVAWGDANVWSIETNPKVLLAILPKPKAGATVSARDLDDKFAFPCVLPDSDGNEDRSNLKSDYAIVPRVLLTDKFRNQIWICTHTKGYKKISDGHYLATESFGIFLREPSRPARVLADGGEMMVQPIDLIVEQSLIVLRENLSFERAKPTMIVPLSQEKIECSAATCNVGRKVCLLSAKGINAEAELRQFDQSIEKYRKSHGEGDPPMRLDYLLILAATGNKQAAARIENYPVDIGDNASDSEILHTYQGYLEDAKKLNCRP